jgi:hypothetical protein
LRILNERERPELRFYKVWIQVIDDGGEVNEVNIKKILNVNK